MNTIQFFKLTVNGQLVVANRAVLRSLVYAIHLERTVDFQNLATFKCADNTRYQPLLVRAFAGVIKVDGFTGSGKMDASDVAQCRFGKDSSVRAGFDDNEDLGRHYALRAFSHLVSAVEAYNLGRRSSYLEFLNEAIVTSHQGVACGVSRVLETEKMGLMIRSDPFRAPKSAFIKQGFFSRQREPGQYVTAIEWGPLWF